MYSDVSLKFKNHFEQVDLQAWVWTYEELEKYLKSLQLEDLGPGQREGLILKELKGVEQEILGFERKEYLLLAEDPANLCKLFSTRLIFQPRQEAIHMGKGKFLHEKRQLLTRLFTGTTLPGEFRQALYLEPMTPLEPRKRILLNQPWMGKDPGFMTCFQTRVDILCSMAPDSGILEQLMGFLPRAIEQINQGTSLLPLQQEMNRAFDDDLFELAYDYLKEELDKQPVNRKYFFIQCIRRDLIYKRHKAQRNEQVFSHYYDPLIELFENEWKYIQSVEIEDPLSIEDLLYERKAGSQTREPKKRPEPKPDAANAVAFTYNNTTGDHLPLVHKTFIELGTIPRETTVPQLREFVNGKECQHPIPWLAGLGDLMVFIKELASNGKVTFPYQQQWNIAVRCFVQPDGTNFNATVLKASRPTPRAAKFIKAANQF